jgi:hypothetical protein
LKGRSIYTNYVGETPWWTLTALSAGLIVVNRRKQAKSTRKSV